jgi:hypothetical protein
MWKFLKLLIGLLLLPFCAAVSTSVYKLYQASVGTSAGSGVEAYALPAGFLIWALVFFLLPRPVRTYVLGHELTHAFWALMMGGRVGRMKVGKSGGHVELSKSNFLITLAPYFFPFYTFLVVAAYYLLEQLVDVEAYRALWLGAVGLTWSFHITFTVHTLASRQPDVQEHGRIFSYVIIYIMNVLMIGFWMVIIGSPEWAAFGELLRNESATAYNTAWSWLVTTWTTASGWIRKMIEGSIG